MHTGTPEFEAARTASEAALDVLIDSHGAQVIPVVLGAMLIWAIENGAAELMEGTLTRALTALPLDAASHRARMS